MNEPAVGVQQEIGVLDPFGNALVGQQGADIVAGEELLEFLVGDIGIDGHGRTRCPPVPEGYSAASPLLRTGRGSGKKMPDSSTAETVSTLTS